MSLLDIIISNPNKSFSTTEVAEALKTTPGAVQMWIKRREIKHERVAGRNIIRGKWLTEYLLKLNNG